ncbi:nucleotidyltransferase domain-containing protein [Candidatus Woesearchaeota archaeon]|nr:nucleotidyltransferase domain-containing protein [Candidatus Woesearchaeota archaeon]
MEIIAPKKKSLLKKIAQKYDLELILAFGSQIGGKARQDSDLDIAVLPGRSKDFNLDKYSSLISDLSEVFSGKEIDLSFINKANPLLLKRVCDNALLLSGTLEKFIEVRLRAFKYFQDYLPYFKLEEMGVRRYLKQLSYGHR